MLNSIDAGSLSIEVRLDLNQENIRVQVRRVYHFSQTVNGCHYKELLQDLSGKLRIQPEKQIF